MVAVIHISHDFHSWILNITFLALLANNLMANSNPPPLGYSNNALIKLSCPGLNFYLVKYIHCLSYCLFVYIPAAEAGRTLVACGKHDRYCNAIFNYKYISIFLCVCVCLFVRITFFFFWQNIYTDVDSPGGWQNLGWPNICDKKICDKKVYQKVHPCKRSE